jgi:16S rRNA C967 or C1407 C5-methylase (RsmB/RsmF family)
LLSTYSDLVAPGGTLTYGLCTFRKAETIEIVEAFQSKHPDFEPIAGGYLGPGPCDGFFMQAFRRKAK